MFLERIVCIIQCDPGQAVMGKALGEVECLVVSSFIRRFLLNL